MASRPPGGTRAQRDAVTQRRKYGEFFDLKITGQKNVIKNLNTLKLNIARKVVNAAIEEAAKRIMAPAVKASLAKVSPGRFGSGKLKTSKVSVYKVAPRKKTSMYWQVGAPSRRALGLKPGEFYYPLILERGGPASGFYGHHIIQAQNMLKRTRNQKAASMNKFLGRTIRLFMEDEITRIAGVNIRRLWRGGNGGKPMQLTRSDSQIATFKTRGVL